MFEAKPAGRATVTPKEPISVANLTTHSSHICPEIKLSLLLSIFVRRDAPAWEDHEPLSYVGSLKQVRYSFRISRYLFRCHLPPLSEKSGVWLHAEPRPGETPLGEREGSTCNITAPACLPACLPLRAPLLFLRLLLLLFAFAYLVSCVS